MARLAVKGHARNSETPPFNSVTGRIDWNFRRDAVQSGMILAGDIGGTKASLGLFKHRAGQLKLVRDATFASRRYACIEDLLREFLSASSSPKIESACLGVAGPVANGRVQLTNLSWDIDAADLKKELRVGAVFLINDMEACGHGLAELGVKDFCVLNRGSRGARGNAAIMSAGTGLGEAGLFWDGKEHHPFACEGGHADFSPVTELDAELFLYLKSRFGRVSCEQLLSGGGLVHIYEFLRHTRRGGEPASFAKSLAAGDPAAVISRAAMNGESSRCAQALELFVSYYGSEAGNLALKLMATSGVYVGGGIAPKILPQLRRGGFLGAFLDKSPMRSLLEQLPVRVILNPGTALLGAANFATFGAQDCGRQRLKKSV